MLELFERSSVVVEAAPVAEKGIFLPVHFFDEMRGVYRICKAPVELSTLSAVSMFYHGVNSINTPAGRVDSSFLSFVGSLFVGLFDTFIYLVPFDVVVPIAFRQYIVVNSKETVGLFIKPFAIGGHLVLVAVTIVDMLRDTCDINDLIFLW